MPRYLLMVNGASETNTCPCCGGPHREGLFALQKRVHMPLAVKTMAEHGGIDARYSDDGTIISAAERIFALADLGLPMNRIDTPLHVMPWIELDSRHGKRLLRTRAGEKQEFFARAYLASDVPGFPGSLGCEVSVDVTPGALPRVRVCSDTRIAALSRSLSHEEMVALYRATWDNPHAVADAVPELRGRTGNAWRSALDRGTHRRTAVPSPMFAGIVPAEVLIAPPVDTGDAAVLATIGCAEASTGLREPTEIVTRLKNPSPDLIDCFAEFAYLSRGNEAVLDPTTVIPEQRTIPGSRSMTAWLLCEPSWREIDSWVPDYLELDDGGRIRVLDAIPLHEVEYTYAQRFGVARLTSKLQYTDEDLTDVGRPPVVSMN